MPLDGAAPTLADRFRAFLADQSFPCVGAKSALAHDTLRIVVARDITSAWDDVRIVEALVAFAADYAAAPKPFQSFAVLFETPGDLTEADFETALWERLQSFSDKDAWLGQAHDPRVSEEVDNPHFSLSFGGEAFFVVGLHPNASRPGRRFETPAMVFNPHDQFEQLRRDGRYERLRERILSRDVAIAGDVNPMLARHGEVSEARQYSGRAVDDDWECPLTPPERSPPE